MLDVEEIKEFDTAMPGGVAGGVVRSALRLD